MVDTSMVLYSILLTLSLLQVVDGCICINPGRLTKKTSGGTFGKIMVKSNSEIGVEVVHI